MEKGVDCYRRSMPKKNNHGFISLFWLFLIVVIIGIGIIGQAHSERKVLADDIDRGKLILTPEAKEMIKTGDIYLRDAGRRERDFGHRETFTLESDLYRAFIAKVWFERARLEMEIEK